MKCPMGDWWRETGSYEYENSWLGCCWWQSLSPHIVCREWEIELADIGIELNRRQARERGRQWLNQKHNRTEE